MLSVKQGSYEYHFKKSIGAAGQVIEPMSTDREADALVRGCDSNSQCKPNRKFILNQ